MWLSFRPAIFPNSSPDRCVEVAWPVEANETDPGSARASLIRSPSELTGRPGYTTSTFGIVAISVTGTRSLAVSYGSLAISIGFSAYGIAVRRTVCPSGAALATMSVAMTVLAPGLFSTITGTPQRSFSFAATSLAWRSVAPPGG